MGRRDGRARLAALLTMALGGSVRRNAVGKEFAMGLRLYGKDPENPGNQCPAVFRDPRTGDFYFQGETVLDQDTLTWINERSPLLATESVVRLPARMVSIILEACGGTGVR